MNVIDTLNTIEQLVQMYRSSIALEQNAAVKQELESEALKAINIKSKRYLDHLEMKSPDKLQLVRAVNQQTKVRFNAESNTTAPRRKD